MSSLIPAEPASIESRENGQVRRIGQIPTITIDWSNRLVYQPPRQPEGPDYSCRQM